MVKSCWICKTSGNKLNKSYFRIPKILSHRNSKISLISALRKKKWHDILVLPENTSGIRVCSDHFISGNPARLLDVNDPDWVPTLKLKRKITSHRKCRREIVKQEETGFFYENSDSNGNNIDFESSFFQCHFCRKTIKKRLVMHILKELKPNAEEMIELVLGHEVGFDEIPSYLCHTCLKKISMCARLLRFFRRKDEKLMEQYSKEGEGQGNYSLDIEHLQEEPGEAEEIKIDSGILPASCREEGSEEELTKRHFIEVASVGSLYDTHQIRPIIDNNSVSGEDDSFEVQEKLAKCKKRKYNLQMDSVRPTEVKTLKCNNCYTQFLKLNDLKLHKNFCKLFYCQLCRPQVAFRMKSEQILHRKTHHSHSLLCHVCGKNYSQSYLAKHFRNHFEDRRKCPFCWKTLKNFTIYMKHLDNVHSERFSCVCEFCGGYFKNLRKHLIICGKEQCLRD